MLQGSKFQKSRHLFLRLKITVYLNVPVKIPTQPTTSLIAQTEKSTRGTVAWLKA